MALMMEEENCISWKSFLWDIPQGVLKFAINAGINTLPTFDNLKRWGKRVNNRCPFCGNIQTLLHVLSGCSVALDQGRYTWRHNSVLNSIIDSIRPALGPSFKLFSDLPGYEAPHGGTIPPHILVTNLRPDLFIVSESLQRADMPMGCKCVTKPIILSRKSTLPQWWTCLSSIPSFISLLRHWFVARFQRKIRVALER